MSTTFVNPYSSASNNWSYGFNFREDRYDLESPYIQVVVTSDRRWDAKARDRDFSYENRIGGGTLNTFNTGAGGRNHLRVVAIGERGWLFVNGEFVSSLDLSDVTGAGDVAVITGAFEGDEISGSVTRFENFRGAELAKRYGPADGTLEYGQGFISQHDSGVWTRNLVVEAEFVNPQGSDWDYGFVIRNPESGRLEVIGLAYGPWWFHDTRDIGDDGYTTKADGHQVNLLSRNHLLIIAFEGAGWFFVNDRLVSKLDLGHNLDSGNVSAMGGFFSNHTGEPSFENFNVWVP